MQQGRIAPSGHSECEVQKKGMYHSTKPRAWRNQWGTRTNRHHNHNKGDAGHTTQRMVVDPTHFHCQCVEECGRLLASLLVHPSLMTVLWLRLPLTKSLITCFSLLWRHESAPLLALQQKKKWTFGPAPASSQYSLIQSPSLRIFHDLQCNNLRHYWWADVLSQIEV